MRNKFIYRIMAGILAITSLSLVVSCDDDEDPSAAPTVTLSAESITDKPGNTVTVTVSVDAPNGGKTLQVSGVDVDDVTLTGNKQEDVEVQIAVPANAIVGSTITAVFVAVDKQNLSSAPVEFVITVGDPMIVLESNITTNMTLDATKRYLLRGKVYVQSGATLTIPAGTILFGEKDTDGTLIINRGAKLDAQGTATNPIIMTSQAPKGFRNRGDWGGVVLLGYAYNSNGVSAGIEGITAQAGSDNGLYGPKDAAAADNDNSGTLKYVRIEYAGIALSDNNELNSLTLGSVGSGTTIDHIFVSYANDDAYEWFGGSVNMKYLIAYLTNDDDFDTDRGYNGKVQFGLVVRDNSVADFSGSKAWESSSNGSATLGTVGGTSRHSAPVFSNITVLGPRLFGAANAIDTDYKSAFEANQSSAIKVHNSIITGFPASAVYVAPNTATLTSNVFAANTSATNTTQIETSAPASFATDNTLEASVVNIFGAFTTKSASTLANPDLYSLTGLPNLGFQTATSPYLTGAMNLSADPFFENVTYKGAFGTSAAAGWNYSSAWVNFDPNNANY